jgi:hypothetical protein
MLRVDQAKGFHRFHALCITAVPLKNATPAASKHLDPPSARGQPSHWVLSATLHNPTPQALLARPSCCEHQIEGIAPAPSFCSVLFAFHHNLQWWLQHGPPDKAACGLHCCPSEVIEFSTCCLFNDNNAALRCNLNRRLDLDE